MSKAFGCGCGSRGSLGAPGPDTRRSWVVAGACFVVTFVTFGLLRCYGLLYVSVLQSFGTTREAASWPFSVGAAAMNLMGPAAGLLNRRFGCRRVVLAGCATAAAGSAACFFAPSVLFLTIAFGLVQGAACGVVMLQVPVTVNQHFVKYRTTAQGLAFSGATVATFLYPSLLEYLVREYGIRGTFLLVGGILLHGAVGGSLIDTPPWILRREQASAASSHAPEIVAQDRSSKYRCPETSLPDNLQEEDPEAKDVNWNRPVLDPCKRPDFHPLTELRPLSQQWVLVKSPWEIQDVEVNEEEQTQTLLPPPPPAPPPGVHRGFPRVLVVRTVPERLGSEPGSLQRRFQGGADSPDSGSGQPGANTHGEALLRASNSSVVILVKDIGKDMIFWLLTVSWATFFFAYITYILVIVDSAKDQGIAEEDAIFLFSSFSLGDLVGRLGFGWVTDRGFVRRKNFVLVTSVAMGLALVMLPLNGTYAFHTFISVVVGLTVGSTMILYISLVGDYMRPDQVAMTLGLIGFINGLLSLGRPFLVGFFRDVHGSYDQLFYTVGSLTVVSASAWFLEPFVVQRRSGGRRIQTLATALQVADGDLDSPT